MQTSVNERIKLIAEKLYSGNITAMAKATYISRTTINSIIGEKEVSPGYDVIRKIAEISSPKINLDWLITGAGDMFLDGSAEKNISILHNQTNSNNSNKVNDSEVIIKLLAQLEEKDRQIAARDKQITDLIEIIKSVR